MVFTSKIESLYIEYTEKEVCFMCGYTGFTGDVQDKNKIINAMTDKIIHRGPNEFGVHIDDKISLGFRRLSIVGIESGRQPMYNEDNTIVLVFNGEIYNYKALKSHLMEKGHVFRSLADSEVLVHLYEEKGVEMLSSLRGMFSFTVYDSKQDLLFSARDHFGIKPYYYTLANGNLLFGSEIKSFLEHPHFKKEFNIQALENYLTFQYSVLAETFFKGVFKLPPAHYLTFKDGKLEIKRYWKPVFSPQSLQLSKLVNKIDSTIQESIELHKDCDVEVGSFLSSGVDSSYIAASFKGEKTFTVGFDYENYSEIGYAKSLSQKVGFENYSKIITKEEFWDSLGKVQYHMDEPLADPAAVPLYFVSKLASEHVTVALSGEGADELFGGYNIYKEPMDLKVITSFPKPIRKALASIAMRVPFKFRGKNFIIRGSKSVEERFIGNANIFSKKEREKILKKPTGNFDPSFLTKSFYDDVKNYDEITKMQHIDINFWLVGDILLKSDKMSMANSLEVRVPILDIEVFKVASKIQTSFRVTKEETKYAFRKAAKKRLPENVSKKKKLGFPVPIRIWLKEEKFYSQVKAAFTGGVSDKYFETDKLVKLLDDHRDGKDDNSRKIWTVYMFLIWHDQYFPEAV